MKKNLSIILVALLTIALMLTLTGCGSDTAPTTTEAPVVTEAPAVTEAPVAEVTEAPVVTEAPAAEVTEAPVAEEVNAAAAVEVAFGDFEAMSALSKSIQNMEMTGKVVSIDGTLNKVGSGFSIGQKNDAGEYVGTKITTAEGIELPASGTRVKVTGTVEQNGFVCTINVTALEIVAE